MVRISCAHATRRNDNAQPCPEGLGGWSSDKGKHSYWRASSRGILHKCMTVEDFICVRARQSVLTHCVTSILTPKERRLCIGVEDGSSKLAGLFRKIQTKQNRWVQCETCATKKVAAPANDRRLLQNKKQTASKALKQGGSMRSDLDTLACKQQGRVVLILFFEDTLVEPIVEAKSSHPDSSD